MPLTIDDITIGEDGNVTIKVSGDEETAFAIDILHEALNSDQLNAEEYKQLKATFPDYAEFFDAIATSPSAIQSFDVITPTSPGPRIEIIAENGITNIDALDFFDPFNYTLRGNATDNILRSHNPGDVLDGGDGNDSLTSYSSSYLRGGAGDDTLGSDMEGSVGDVMDGGEGADAYIVRYAVGLGNNEYSYIPSFDPAEGDKLDISMAVPSYYLPEEIAGYRDKMIQDFVPDGANPGKAVRIVLNAENNIENGEVVAQELIIYGKSKDDILKEIANGTIIISAYTNEWYTDSLDKLPSQILPPAMPAMPSLSSPEPLEPSPQSQESNGILPQAQGNAEASAKTCEEPAWLSSAKEVTHDLLEWVKDRTPDWIDNRIDWLEDKIDTQQPCATPNALPKENDLTR